MTARIDQLLADARATLPPRPTPAELPALVEAGALVVDIRPVEQRDRDGELRDLLVLAHFADENSSIMAGLGMDEPQ